MQGIPRHSTHRLAYGMPRSMTIQLYIYGCQTCGVNATYVRRLKALYNKGDIELDVKNSKYDTDALVQHTDFLKSTGMDVDTYPPIVVHDGEVTPLREWRL